MTHPAAKILTRKLFRFILTSLCKTRSGSAQSARQIKKCDLRDVGLPTA
jgi:hypothetical protein